MRRTVIAIDPGSSSGAIVHCGPGQEQLTVANMPPTPFDIWNHLRKLKEGDARVVCYMEDVGTGRPGNSARSMHTFAVHQGHLEMALLATGIPCFKVRPQEWLKALFGDKYPKGPENKDKRKQYVYDQMQRRWPEVGGFTKRQADAMAIFTWAVDLKENQDER